ncbi:SH3 domain-containing protein [Aphanothece microscopica]|uniref:SH3 domain-containing protein n=1 Tax=Aphanothece microscopica TaxID=1049561 RepID=UPI003CE55F96
MVSDGVNLREQPSTSSAVVTRADGRKPELYFRMGEAIKADTSQADQSGGLLHQQGGWCAHNQGREGALRGL